MSGARPAVLGGIPLYRRVLPPKNGRGPSPLGGFDFAEVIVDRAAQGFALLGQAFGSR